VADWDALCVVRLYLVPESHTVCIHSVPPLPIRLPGRQVRSPRPPCHLLPRCRGTRYGSWRLSFHVGAQIMRRMNTGRVLAWAAAYRRQTLCCVVDRAVLT